MRPLLFSISPAIKGAAVYNDTPSFSPYKRGGLLLGGEGRREKNRGPGVPWSSSLHVSRRYSFSVLTDVVPTNGLTRFVQQRRGLSLKKFFPRDSISRRPRDGIVEMAWPYCSVSRETRRTTRAPAVEHRSSSFTLSFSLSSCFFLSLLLPPSLSILLTLAVYRPDMWRMKGAGQPSYTRRRRYFF